MMEGTRCEEIETSNKIESKIKTESIIEIDSIFYEEDGKLVELDSDLQKDFCAVMETIKYEKTEVTKEMESVYTEPATLSETCGIPRSEQSLEFSRIISEFTEYTPLMSLCRLCATRSNSMVYMFSQNEMQNNIVEKIEYCLPIEVKKTDTLPKEVCHLCLEKLDLCYQFHKTVKAAEKLFLTFDDGQYNVEKYKSFSDQDAHRNIFVQKPPKIDTETLENSTILSNSMFRKKMYCTTNRPNEESRTESSSDEDESICNSLLTFPLHIWNDMEEKLRSEIKPSPKEEARNDKSDDDIAVREAAFNKRRSAEQDIIGHEVIKCRNCRKTFKTVIQSLAHSCIHGSKGYFRCCLCGAILRSKKDWNKHSLEHEADENLRKGGVQTSSGNESLKKSFREANLKAKIKLNSKISSKDKSDCKTCNEDIDSETSLHQRRQHMLTVHKQQPRSSHNMSERELSDSEQLIAPQSTHDFNFQCKLCNRTFRSNYILEAHKQTGCKRPLVSPKNEFSCVHCNQSFRLKGNLKTHLGIHTGERPYGCDLCGKMFRVKNNRDSHRKIHTGERPYKCFKCEKRFTTSSARSSHSLVHTDARPYSCHLCPLSFKKIRARNLHLRVHTGERPYKCLICEKSFTTSSILTRHSIIHSDDKPFSCNLCHVSFKTIEGRDVHLRIHTGEKPYKCSKCEKRFSTSSALTRHFMVHSNVKPYSCDLCHSSFKTSNKRDIHLRVHTGEKPFKCSKCEKRFTTSSILRRHSLVHSDTTTYGCHLCRLSFRTTKARDVHLRVHTGERPYKCDACGVRYTKNSLLLRHKRLQSCLKKLAANSKE